MADPKKLNNIITDLKKIKQALIPDDGAGDGLTDEEMKMLDKFQKKKRELNILLKRIRDKIAELQEYRRKLGEDSRDPNIIRIQSENSVQLKLAGDTWKDLKDCLAEDQRSKKQAEKLGQKELENRNSAIRLLGQEICTLTNQNARVKDSGPKNVDDLTKSTERNENAKDAARRKEKEARKIKRKGDRSGRTKGDALELTDDDFRDVKPASAQEQKFMDQVQANVAEQDEMLDEISKGLDELKELSLDMNKALTVQNAMIGEVGDEMDRTIEKFKTANSKLKDMLEEQGGMTRWCPIIVCTCLLLAMCGYMANMFR